MSLFVAWFVFIISDLVIELMTVFYGFSGSLHQQTLVSISQGKVVYKYRQFGEILYENKNQV